MYEDYVRIRDKAGYTDYRVAKELGWSRGTIDAWKHGRATPKIDKLQELADLFEVPRDLLEKGQVDRAQYLSDTSAIVAQQILESPELALLFKTAVNAKPEDIKTAHQMLLALKAKEKNEK